jgi:hypothetical protein
LSNITPFNNALTNINFRQNASIDPLNFTFISDRSFKFFKFTIKSFKFYVYVKDVL